MPANLYRHTLSFDPLSARLNHLMHPALQSRWADYFAFHHAQLATGDIDPVYPWLARTADLLDLSVADRAWLCVLHVTWYHPASTLAAFSLAPSFAHFRALLSWHTQRTGSGFDALQQLGLLSLPTGIERRGHRDPLQLARTLLAFPSWYPESGNLRHLFTDLFRIHEDPFPGVPASTAAILAATRAASGASDPLVEVPWDRLNDRLASLPGNGRWAAYKLAELLSQPGLANLPTYATDAGHRYSSGPRKGLADLFMPRFLPAPTDQSTTAIATLDALTELVRDWLGAVGPEFPNSSSESGSPLYEGPQDIAQVETSLCDFHSLLRGHYYLGHDIDQLALAIGPQIDLRALALLRPPLSDPRFEINGHFGGTVLGAARAALTAIPGYRTSPEPPRADAAKLYKTAYARDRELLGIGPSSSLTTSRLTATSARAS